MWRAHDQGQPSGRRHPMRRKYREKVAVPNASPITETVPLCSPEQDCIRESMTVQDRSAVPVKIRGAVPIVAATIHRARALPRGRRIGAEATVLHSWCECDRPPLRSALDCEQVNSVSNPRQSSGWKHFQTTQEEIVMNKTLAMAAISGLMLGAAATTYSSTASAESNQKPASNDKGSGDKHACKGHNACKEKGGCKTEKHACKAQNACKGQGGCKSS